MGYLFVGIKNLPSRSSRSSSVSVMSKEMGFGGGADIFESID